jgi:hypothetical protein
MVKSFHNYRNIEFEELLEKHETSDCRGCLVKAHRLGRREVWLQIQDYVGENGISLSQLNQIINTHLKRINEMEKGLK